VGVTFLFPELGPNINVDLQMENKTSWAIRFGQESSDGKRRCSGCGVDFCGNDVEDFARRLETISIFTVPKSSAFFFEKLNETKIGPSTMGFFFANFLNFDADKKYCDDCVQMFQLLFALQFGTEKDLAW
jgi:hypothetical protein